MIVKRPSLFVFAVRVVELISDVAVTVTFSTGFLSGPRTRPRMTSAASCACSGAKRPRSAMSKNKMMRRGNTEASWKELDTSVTQSGRRMLDRAPRSVPKHQSWIHGGATIAYCKFLTRRVARPLDLIEIQIDRSEMLQLRLQLQNDARRIIRQPELGVSILGEHGRRRDFRLQQQRRESSGRYGHRIPFDYTNDDGVAFRTEIAAQLITLPGLERQRRRALHE